MIRDPNLRALYEHWGVDAVVNAKKEYKRILKENEKLKAIATKLQPFFKV